MKKNANNERSLLFPFALLGFGLLAVYLLYGCTPESLNAQGDEYVIRINDRNLFEVDTKATAVTSIPSSLYWCATTGASGSSDAQKYAPSQGAVATGVISTGKYMTAVPTSYNWYLSNKTMTIAASGPTISVTDNGTDIVAGVTKATNSVTPSVELQHIFARTGSLTFNTQTGYTVSNVSWKISRATSGTTGTYNIATNKWTPNATAMAATALTSSSDMYLIPGDYTITVTYTLTKENYKETFTRSGSTKLVQGKVNSITATATGGNAVKINVSTTLSGWTAGSGSQLVF